MVLLFVCFGEVLFVSVGFRFVVADLGVVVFSLLFFCFVLVCFPYLPACRANPLTWNK